MFTIIASVGENSSNKPADVKEIQEGLNRILTGRGGQNTKLDTDGLIGPKTVAAIKGFQTHNQLTVNGRIEPNDATLAKLNELAGGNVPAPAPISGIDWEFINAREGGQILKGYVPHPETSKSGVTNATCTTVEPFHFVELDLSPQVLA